MTKVLLAIPCYNCECQIGRVLRGLTVEVLDRVHAIVMIDNCSVDGTIDRALETARTLNLKNFRILRNQTNLFLGGTHKVAFLEAKRLGCSHLAILHGDDQGIPAELVRHLSVLQDDFDAVLASRFIAGSSLQGYSKVRTLGNRAMNILYSVVSGFSVHDVGGCTSVFRLDAFPNDEFLNFTDGFTFNNDLLLYLIEKKLSVRYVPVTWRETDQRSNVNAFRLGLKMLRTLLRWRLYGSPEEPYREISRYRFEAVS